jgi:hypothetical protein
MPSTPPDTGQPTRGAGTGHEDRGERGNKWWTLVAVCLGTFMLLLDITIVTVALPDIQRALHSSFSDLQWVVDAYALTLAAFLLTAGSLADMYGRRRMYLIGLVVCRRSGGQDQLVERFGIGHGALVTVVHQPTAQVEPGSGHAHAEVDAHLPVLAC